LNAIDTNILVYAHRQDSTFHERAQLCVRRHAEAEAAWAIPWPCLHEFLAIVTNPRIFKSPTPIEAALVAEEDGYWPLLAELVKSNGIRAGKVHDARIAALALHHGARELLSADRDFSRMAPLVVRNPL
jgi:predicted nucleic acid-binding protein